MNAARHWPDPPPRYGPGLSRGPAVGGDALPRHASLPPGSHPQHPTGENFSGRGIRCTLHCPNVLGRSLRFCNTMHKARKLKHENTNGIFFPLLKLQFEMFPKKNSPWQDSHEDSAHPNPRRALMDVENVEQFTRACRIIGKPLYSYLVF